MLVIRHAFINYGLLKLNYLNLDDLNTGSLVQSKKIFLRVCKNFLSAKISAVFL